MRPYLSIPRCRYLLTLVATILVMPVAMGQEALPRTRPELIRALNNVKADIPAQQKIHDALLARGVDGAELLLNLFYPESVATPTLASPRGKAWRRELNSGDDARAKSALLDLYHFGPLAEPLVAEMARSADPARRLWLRGVLTAWKEEALHENCRAYFWGGLFKTKDPAVLDLLAQRVCVALEDKTFGSSVNLERQIISLLGGTTFHLGVPAADRFLDPLIPLLDHPDEGLAQMVIATIGDARGPWSVPNFVFASLSHKREAVVDFALGYTQCWDKKQQPKMRRYLQAIFHGDNEKLKFHACWGLVVELRDPEALAYVLTQTRSKDKSRVKDALRLLGNPQTRPWLPAPGEVLECLDPLLRSEDSDLRLHATRALGRYAGADVIRHMIPRLADREAGIATAAHDALLYNWQRDWDRAVLRRRLTEAADDGDGRLREAARKLLEKMNTK